MRRLVALAVLGVAAFFASPATATAPTVVFSGTTVTGVNGLMVNGTQYNVSFVGGTCADVFGGTCANFTFTDQTSALAAGNALLAVVGEPSGTSPVDPLTNPIANCGNGNCDVLIPYATGGSDVLGVADLLTPNASYVLANDQVPITSNFSGDVFASFSAVTPALPEPATWAMMLVGFGAIGWQMRRRRPVGALRQPA